MKVCHVASGDLWAGAEVQVFNMVSAQNESGAVDVSALLLNEGRLTNELRRLGIRTEVIEEDRHSFYEILRQADRWLSGRNIDIIHSHRFKENILAAKLRQRNRARYLVQTVHGLGEPFRGITRLKAGVMSYANRWYSRRYFDLIVAVSEDIGRSLRPHFGDERVAVVYNSVEMPVGDAAADRLRIRAEFELDDTKILIGTAGRLTPVKAYDQFLLAAREIANVSPQARFLIAGDGPLGDSLKAQANQLGLADKVLFPGFRNDMPAVLAAMDIFVMSSLHEGIPVVLLEAMALARPVVVTAVGGMVEVVEDGRSGQLVAAGNSRELAGACVKLIKDPNFRTRLGLAAADRVRSEFTVQNQSHRLIEIYGMMIDQSEASE